jgi:hypothetical protein
MMKAHIIVMNQKKNEPLISFSNSYYKGNKYDVQDY